MADPTPPAFTEGHLARDLGPEIDRLLDKMRDMTEQELMDQVYRRLVLYLCTAATSAGSRIRPDRDGGIGKNRRSLFSSSPSNEYIQRRGSEDRR